MQYMLLIYENEVEARGGTPEQVAAMYDEYRAFTRSLRAAGKLIATDPLQPTTMATTVRLRDGKQLVTDGPFAETHEHLGGYYIIEAADLDEARAIAARVPSATRGSIEVRPLMRLPPG